MAEVQIDDRTFTVRAEYVDDLQPLFDELVALRAQVSRLHVDLADARADVDIMETEVKMCEEDRDRQLAALRAEIEESREMIALLEEEAEKEQVVTVSASPIAAALAAIFVDPPPAPEGESLIEAFRRVLPKVQWAHGAEGEPPVGSTTGASLLIVQTGDRRWQCTASTKGRAIAQGLDSSPLASAVACMGSLKKYADGLLG